MSLLARSSRTAPRFVRALATNAPAGSQYFAQLNALREHAAHTTDLWRKISFYVAFPATFVTCAWVYSVESEHAAHEDPLIEENNGTLPQPPPYPYLNRRVKPFPWGSNSLFFNPRYNMDMDKVDG
ncbi:COX6A, subunit VIa of cytochrome c oxidase [Boletus edulis]|uniref:Mitochondrial cytochrome c oxidase subunit VIa n=1 Tax=Boletus edulis BED1 TaxID=1328754 RepID=A0AAD4GJC6_BOLED|nr:COX6A, subunit VIa of cytochrome c oxidase [Boletus edulis]KAF8445845.1 mitochondrial cytochrome c oxidase subunit VIa [Boletus edulis BED1]